VGRLVLWVVSPTPSWPLELLTFFRKSHSVSNFAQDVRNGKASGLGRRRCNSAGDWLKIGGEPNARTAGVEAKGKSWLRRGNAGFVPRPDRKPGAAKKQSFAQGNDGEVEPGDFGTQGRTQAARGQEACLPGRMALENRPLSLSGVAHRSLWGMPANSSRIPPIFFPKIR